MTGEELETKLLEALAARSKGRLHCPLDWETLEDFIRKVHNGEKFEVYEPPAQIPLPVIPPEFPKLKVRYDYPTSDGRGGSGQALEFIVVQNYDEEYDYHSGGWYTRPMTELEIVKTTAKERLKTSWERHKQEAE